MIKKINVTGIIFLVIAGVGFAVVETTPEIKDIKDHLGEFLLNELTNKIVAIMTDISGILALLSYIFSQIPSYFIVLISCLTFFISLCISSCLNYVKENTFWLVESIKFEQLIGIRYFTILELEKIEAMEMVKHNKTISFNEIAQLCYMWKPIVRFLVASALFCNLLGLCCISVYFFIVWANRKGIIELELVNSIDSYVGWGMGLIIFIIGIGFCLTVLVYIFYYVSGFFELVLNSIKKPSSDFKDKFRAYAFLYGLTSFASIVQLKKPQ